jgi:hypothetical protein
MSKVGVPYNDCGGKTTKLIAEYAGNVKCEGGGTLKDKIDGGGDKEEETKEEEEEEGGEETTE